MSVRVFVPRFLRKSEAEKKFRKPAIVFGDDGMLKYFRVELLQERFQTVLDAGHEAELTPVDVEAIAAAMQGLGLEATGAQEMVAGVPAKVVRAVRPD